MIIQVLVVLLGMVTTYHSFVALNLCDKFTAITVRYAHITAFTGSIAVIIQVSMGVVPDWAYILVLSSLSLKYMRERRKINLHNNKMVKL